MTLRLLLISLMFLPGFAPLCGSITTANPVVTPTTAACDMDCETTCPECCCEIDSSPSEVPTDAPFVPATTVRITDYLPASTPLLYVLADSCEPATFTFTSCDFSSATTFVNPQSILCSWLT